jgi:hypothetical protein
MSTRIWELAEEVVAKADTFACVSGVESKKRALHRKIVYEILRSKYRSISIPNLYQFGYFINPINKYLVVSDSDFGKCIICGRETRRRAGVYDGGYYEGGIRYIYSCSNHTKLEIGHYELSILIPKIKPITIKTPVSCSELEIHVAAEEKCWRRIAVDPLIGVVQMNRFFIIETVKPTKMDKVIAALAR